MVSPSVSKLLNNNRNTPSYFSDIKENSVLKKYKNAKANSNKCSRNNSCKKKDNKNKLTLTKAKIGLQTLTYGYKKKIKNTLTNMFGLLKGTIKKKEIDVIANSLDRLNKAYNDTNCNSGITMTTKSSRNNNFFGRFGTRNSYKSIDIYQYLIKHMVDKLPNIAPETIGTFINNINKNSNTNSKDKTDLAYEDIMNNNNLKSVFKSVLETLPYCKTS